MCAEAEAGERLDQGKSRFVHGAWLPQSCLQLAQGWGISWKGPALVYPGVTRSGTSLPHLQLALQTRPVGNFGEWWGVTERSSNK